MIDRFRRARALYPSQFWLMFFGMLLSTIGTSMIWPFMMIYVSEKLKLPMTTATSLISISATVGFLSSFVIGPIVDRVGRKWAMVFSLVTNGMVYFLISRADSYQAFVVLMAVQGAVNPLYRVGADAMMADLIPMEHRTDAYALTRMSNNLGISIGPAIGGFIATQSYTVAFYLAATGLIGYGLLMALLGHETLPQTAEKDAQLAARQRFGGYLHILRDRRYLFFLFSFTLNQIGAALVWVLMSVYAKHNYHVVEALYGWIPTTNALMVVLLQLWVTTRTKTRHPLLMLALGSAFYATAVGSVALARDFWGFWISMVIMTIGELILMPTATTYVANLAPVDMRGRYMSLFALTWSVAQATGPLMGGFLSDTFGPASTWYGGATVVMCGVLSFLFLYSRSRKNTRINLLEN